MKRTSIIAALFFAMISTSYAQDEEMSKDEIKELKKEIKSLTPESYKQLVNDKNAAQEEVVNLQDQVDDLETQVVILQSEIDDYKATAMQEEAAEEAADATEEGNVAEPTETVEETNDYTAPVKGLVYKVQIGAFKKFDITKYFNNHQNFGGEVDADGTMKYTIGAFTDYWAADQFKKYLREMGVQGAWVVAYKDGQRVSMQDAREGAL